MRRQLRVQQAVVEDAAAAAEDTLERNFFRRLQRLKPVRRFVSTWILLLLIIIGCSIAQLQQLSGLYQTTQAVPGGIYNEGILGSISNVNPIFATSDVDRTLARLIFAGLLTYDADGHLVNCLASGYRVSDDGKTYTVTLKHDLTWQDGRSLTADDVAYTFNTIKNPDTQSPLFNTWQKVTVAAPDQYTVTFTLPSPLAAFPYLLTTGIIPAHILATTAPSDLRSADFNTMNPIGAGAFMWHGVQVQGSDPDETEEQVALLPFTHYVLGTPKLNEFVVKAYASPDMLTDNFKDGQLTAAAGLTSVPDKLPGGAVVRSMLMNAGTYVFFKTSTGVLADKTVRQALVLAADPAKILQSLSYNTRPVIEPLLAGQLAFNPAYAQKTGDEAAARAQLLAAGWTPNAKGVLTKDGQPLAFTLAATDTPEYEQVSHLLVQQWRKLGAQVKVELLSNADYATALAGHTYDATLYGIALGQDPDVYAYWDSSQADVRSTNRLNLSEWKNTTADDALEAGRTRLDPSLRVIKYAPFLQAWQQDAPALGLYQPRYLYLTHGTVYGLTEKPISNTVDRLNGVQDWQIRTARITNK